MKKLILYVTGGLSNRVFPICSCIEYAKLTGRELFIYWPPDNRCLGTFNDLYETPINLVDINFLKSLNISQTEFHSEFLDGVLNDKMIYGRDFLIDKYNQKLMRIHDISLFGETIDLNKTIPNLFLITNRFLSSIPLETNKNILKNLLIKKDILEDINREAKELNINKKIIGVHVRGTDFNLSNISFYIDSMNVFIRENPDTIFFVCSDDEDLEKQIKTMYPSNIIIRKRKVFIDKKVKGNPWNKNTLTTKESLRDSIIDLYLLSKTNFRIYNDNSTFSHYIKILSE